MNSSQQNSAELIRQPFLDPIYRSMQVPLDEAHVTIPQKFNLDLASKAVRELFFVFNTVKSNGDLQFRLDESMGKDIAVATELHSKTGRSLQMRVRAPLIGGVDIHLLGHTLPDSKAKGEFCSLLVAFNKKYGFDLAWLLFPTSPGETVLFLSAHGKSNLGSPALLSVGQRHLAAVLTKAYATKKGLAPVLEAFGREVGFVAPQNLDL